MKLLALVLQGFIVFPLALVLGGRHLVSGEAG